MFKIIWSLIATIGVGISCYYLHSSLSVTLASLIGVLFVLGVSFKNSYSNLLGAVLTVFYSYLSYKAGYFSNSVINLFILLPLQVTAFFFWKKTEGETFTLNKKMKWIILLSTLILSFASCTVSKFSGSQLWIHDGISSVLVIAATFMLMLKVKEQWFAWIPYNALEVLMWLLASSVNPDMIAIFVLRSIFFINSLIGAYEWFSKKPQSL